MVKEQARNGRHRNGLGSLVKMGGHHERQEFPFLSDRADEIDDRCAKASAVDHWRTVILFVEGKSLRGGGFDGLLLVVVLKEIETSAIYRISFERIVLIDSVESDRVECVWWYDNHFVSLIVFLSFLAQLCRPFLSSFNGHVVIYKQPGCVHTCSHRLFLFLFLFLSVCLSLC